MSETYKISFLTIYTSNFSDFEKTYYTNVKKYIDNEDVEFILLDLSDDETENVQEYVVTNLFYELKREKLKYYKYKNLVNNNDLVNIKNIGHLFSNARYFHNLNIDQLLDGSEHENLQNTIIYDDNLLFEKYKSNFYKFNIDDFKILTCFSVIYNSNEFIDNLINDILSQSIFKNINFILINMLNTNNNETNSKIENLKNYENIKVIDETNDYGLYNMWNNCINMSETYFVSNMNPDDIRGSEWAYRQIINFEPNIILVTPKYIPTKIIIPHTKLISNKKLPVWFEQKCDIKNNLSLKYGDNKYFKSIDMFQFNNDYKKIQSANIPNSCPIWRKNKVHENNNYFNEEKYGCYADYAVWLESGEKYLFKQTDYKVGFYMSNNQLHKRQKNDEEIFKTLILTYANDNFKNWVQK
jgi:hypothetical protein